MRLTRDRCVRLGLSVTVVGGRESWHSFSFVHSRYNAWNATHSVLISWSSVTVEAADGMTDGWQRHVSDLGE